ncbi:MAG: hypothetical protein GC171_11340 [Terrimonas sp.]|nr:hypothetical protein [Terrimonas sp.]
MQLMMYIGNDLIEAVQLEPARLRKPGYVGSFKRYLKSKYDELIRQYPDKPEFLVIDNNPATFTDNSNPTA